jgi:hypothetical protein
MGLCILTGSRVMGLAVVDRFKLTNDNLIKPSFQPRQTATTLTVSTDC